MIVEAFVKGTCFREHYNTFWNVKSILMDGGYFILVNETDVSENQLLSCEEYELRVTY